MDQVLFSEPSTKMKEKMEAIAMERQREAAESQSVKVNSSPDDIASSSVVSETTSEEEKFLNEKFGKDNN